MLKIVDLFIPGTPQGKGRARSFMRNGGISHVTPDKTRTYEGIIRTLAMEAMGAKPPSRMPVKIDLVIVMPIAESWPKWKRHAAKEGYLAPTAKPDSDNVEKAIKDALNGVVWVDDAQAVFGIKEKVFGEKPGVYVKAYALNRVPSGVKSKEEFSDYVKRLGL